MSVEIGIDAETRKKVADGLTRYLADTYVLYMRTHGYHLNVEGPRFHSLHTMFEEQYRDLWASLDELAERIRSLGFYAPGNGKELAAAATLAEADNDRPDAEGMIRSLLAGTEALVSYSRELIELAGEAGDQGTEDLITARMQTLEKSAWMLRASL